MRAILFAIALCGCTRHEEPKQPAYFLSVTIEHDDGNAMTITYQGYEPPEKAFPSLLKQ